MKWITVAARRALISGISLMAFAAVAQAGPVTVSDDVALNEYLWAGAAPTTTQYDLFAGLDIPGGAAILSATLHVDGYSSPDPHRFVDDPDFSLISKTVDYETRTRRQYVCSGPDGQDCGMQDVPYQHKITHYEYDRVFVYIMKDRVQDEMLLTVDGQDATGIVGRISSPETGGRALVDSRHFGAPYSDDFLSYYQTDVTGSDIFAGELDIDMDVTALVMAALLGDGLLDLTFDQITGEASLPGYRIQVTYEGEDDNPPALVPSPAALSLFLLGLAGIARRRMQSRKPGQ